MRYMNIAILLLIFAAGCGPKDSAMREYDEVSIESPLASPKSLPEGNLTKEDVMDSMTMEIGPLQPISRDMGSEALDVSLSWQKPQHWSEEPGQGMRIATFRSDDNPIECSIVSLGGMAGGLEANIKRWLGQIGLELDDDQLKEFITSQEKLTTKDGIKMALLNFTALQNDLGGESPSMIATILEKDNKTIFIKMTGSKESVLKEYEAFKSLCLSLKLNHD